MKTLFVLIATLTSIMSHADSGGTGVRGGEKETPKQGKVA